MEKNEIEKALAALPVGDQISYAHKQHRDYAEAARHRVNKEACAGRKWRFRISRVIVAGRHIYQLERLA